MMVCNILSRLSGIKNGDDNMETRRFVRLQRLINALSYRTPWNGEKMVRRGLIGALRYRTAWNRKKERQTLRDRQVP